MNSNDRCAAVKIFDPFNSGGIVCSSLRGRSVLLVFCLVFAVQALAIVPGDNWKDSYSVDGQCYCATTFDHGAGNLTVETPAGSRTVRQVCDAIGPGPGEAGNPLYNDVQCGNGPANNSSDETICPGRVDLGESGCSIIGPTWNLEKWFPGPDQPSTGDSTDGDSATGDTAAESDNGDDTADGSGVDATDEPSSTVELPDTPATGMDTSNGTAVGGSGNSLTAGPPPSGLYFDAESFDVADDRWLLVKAGAVTSANLQYDPDPLHLNGAEGAAYLEILPDRRVLPTDPASADSPWTVAADGPSLQYEIDFPKAGQYQVFVRAYSTGLHDDTMHVGIDGSWLGTSTFLDLCNQRNQWVWSDCHGAEEPVIQVGSAGIHTVYFAARDDGFEFDSFVLALLDDNTTLAQNSTDEPDIGKAVQVGGGIVPGVGSAAVWFFSITLFAFFQRLVRRYRGQCIRSLRQA